MHKLATCALLALLMLSACTNPNNPSQRAVGGGLMGAGAGAVGGSLLGLDPLTSGLVGAGAGAGLGYITTPDQRHNHH